MKYLLKRIIYAKYDDFVEKTISHTPNITSDFFSELSDYVEDIIINDKEFEFEIDIDSMIKVIDDVIDSNPSNPKQIIDIRFSKYLYESLSINSDIPTNLLYEKEVWAYLNCFIFFNVIIKRFFSKEGDLKNENRVSRVLLSNCSIIDRTGLRWCWSLAEATYSNNYLFGLTETAQRFIDPVKALYERELGSNKVLFKAFIRAIQLINYDPRVRSVEYRSILLTHLRNLASMKIYEAYNDVEELAYVFANDIKEFLGDSVDEELTLVEEREE